jgi:hypothetical protein
MKRKWSIIWSIIWGFIRKVSINLVVGLGLIREGGMDMREETKYIETKYKETKHNWELLKKDIKFSEDDIVLIDYYLNKIIEELVPEIDKFNNREIDYIDFDFNTIFPEDEDKAIREKVTDEVIENLKSKDWHILTHSTRHGVSYKSLCVGMVLLDGGRIT